VPTLRAISAPRNAEGYYGEATAPAGKREQAQEHLTTATTMYRKMGMTYRLAQAQREMTDELG